MGNLRIGPTSDHMINDIVFMHLVSSRRAMRQKSLSHQQSRAARLQNHMRSGKRDAFNIRFNRPHQSKITSGNNIVPRACNIEYRNITSA